MLVCLWEMARRLLRVLGQTFIDVGGRSRQAEAAGVDESLIASWWCATYFFARITAFFTGDAVGCQKTVMLFSREPDSDDGDDGAAAEQPAKRRKESPPWATVNM